MTMDLERMKSLLSEAHLETLAALKPVNRSLESEARDKIDNKTKPPGSLGRLEELGLQVSLVQESLDPVLCGKAMFVFAADHGVAQEGVSAFPAEVTPQMVENFLNNGAAINVLCRHNGIDIRIVDMGVNSDFDDHPALVKKKIRRGSRNFAKEPAMTEAEAIAAIGAGMEVFLEKHAAQSIDIAGMGEMGIGNTTSASAIISAATGISASDATGRGTGVDDAGMAHKAEVIEKALALHTPDPNSGLDILMKVGGLEIAGMVGAILAGAASGAIVVLDGVISTAAGLIASIIAPDVSGYLVAGHRSVEKAQAAALEKIGIVPLLDLNMRLGEGTGAALAIDIVDAACRIMREMASFDDAGVSREL